MVLTQAACPCGFPLTLWSIIKYYWDRLRVRVQRMLVIECPGCKQAIPVNAKTCPHPQCGISITVDATIDESFGPLKSGWSEFLKNVTPKTVRFIQWLYLMLSLALLWGLLDYTEKHHADNWAELAGLSVVYLAVLSFLALMILPGRLFHAFSHGASWRIKLALVGNYFTLLLLLQIAIVAWWARALTLAMLFGVTLVGIWVLRLLLLPMVAKPEASNEFDPSAPQGRRGRYG